MDITIKELSVEPGYEYCFIISGYEIDHAKLEEWLEYHAIEHLIKSSLNSMLLEGYSGPSRKARLGMKKPRDRIIYKKHYYFKSNDDAVMVKLIWDGYEDDA